MGALTLAFDIFDVYLRDLTREGWLGFSNQTRNIATKAETRSSEDGGDYSLAERAETICAELELLDPPLVSALDLMAKWRNVVVHSDNRPPRVSPGTQGVLQGASQFYFDKYAHFRIDLALANFKNRKIPVPKEVTSLTAMAVNLCRSIDEAAIRRIASTSDGAESAAEVMIRDYFTGSDERARSPWSEFAEMWQGDAARRERQLLQLLASLGFSDGKGAVSAPLRPEFIRGLATMPKDSFAEKFEIAR